MKYGLMIVAALLAFVLAGPAEALSAPEARDMARSVGCKAEVYTLASKDVNGYFSVDRDGEPYIVLIGVDVLPETWQRFIAWHEIGHCLQWQSGKMEEIRASGPHELEWDADRFAIRQLANEEVDGAELSEHIWAWFSNKYQFKGSRYSPHGLIVERITRGYLNRVIRNVQSA